MRSAFPLLALVLLANLAAAEDWPQWLGPRRDGSSTQAVTPWTDAPRVVWRKPVGEGHSSPVVAGGRVFLHAKVKDRNEEEVVAYDAANGNEAWRVAYPRVEFKSLFGNGPRATPTVAGGRVYAHGITGVLVCLDAADGKVHWKVDTWKDFNAPRLLFGMSCSPLLEGGAVLLNVGAPGASVVAFDAENGAVRWKALDDKASYASPFALGEGAARQAVFLTHAGAVSLRPKDGTVFWKYPFVDLLAESSSTPVRMGDLLFISSITIGGAGLRLAEKDGKPDATELWKDAQLNCYFSTAVPVGDALYVVTGTKPPALRVEATLHCVDPKTGKARWSRPKVGKYQTSLLRTGNDRLLMLDDSGHLILLDPAAGKYQELARSRVCGNETWAPPALAEGKLYVRDNRELICLELPKY